ncbi:MAG: OmpA family protein [Verrucomicrobia bacterium]|nr:OmpA family protein [Verrucomicrobiota bacterium]
MSKRPLIIASVLSVLAIFFFLGLSAWRNGRLVEQAASELSDARRTIEKDTLQMDDLKAQITNGQAKIEELQRQLQQEKETATQTHQSLEKEMRAALESKDVTISQLQGKLTVNILDRVMFDSGEAALKPDGQSVLQKVANVLAQHPQLKIHVIGHTDNVPIRPSARGRFPSNWELSTSRATAALRFLTEKAGVDPRRVGAVGYGEFRPVADNATPEGRAKNRRIAITILSEELAGADVAPTARPVASDVVPSAPPLSKAPSTGEPADPVSPTNAAGTK